MVIKDNIVNRTKYYFILIIVFCISGTFLYGVDRYYFITRDYDSFNESDLIMYCSILPLFFIFYSFLLFENENNINKIFYHLFRINILWYLLILPFLFCAMLFYHKDFVFILDSSDVLISFLVIIFGVSIYFNNLKVLVKRMPRIGE